jgi:dTMP kinase
VRTDPDLPPPVGGRSEVAPAAERRRPGLFVTFEGVEGAGKSTQLERLRQAVTASGREVVVTREPGGTPIGERVRAILLDPVAAEMAARAEALLFAAARAQLVEQVVRPALDRGAVVLCDRYVDSSIAYQGAGRGLGEDQVEAINRWATGGLWPDVVVLLDLDPAEGLSRAGAQPDRIEGQALDFHRRVGQGFLALARRHPERFVVVDAHGSPDQVAEQVQAALRGCLGP